MPYLLDTNHCSYLMNGLDKLSHRRKPEEVKTIARFQATKDTVYMAEVSLGELVAGAELSPHTSKIYARIANFRGCVVPAPIDELCWELYGKTKAALRKSGKVITDMDLLIACAASRYGSILVSNDAAFAHLPSGFHVENWAV